MSDRDGCPCNETCCDNPQPYTNHDENCDCNDSACDYNWYTMCRSCGDGCGCEV